MSENWKVGDIAICIRGKECDKTPPVRVGVKYIVMNIYTCPKCKQVCLDVGLSSGINAGHTNCTCKEKIPMKEIHWANSNRFIKKKDDKSIEKQIEEAIASENYELAEQLKQNLKLCK